MKIWSTSNNWMEGSSTSDGIWGGTGDTTGSDGDSTTKEGRQGACPDGYYIPSTKDWKDAYDLWYVSYQSLSNTGMQLASDFLLPATKSRDTNGSISNVFTGNYWSSSPDTSSSDSARLFSFSTSDVTSQKSKYRSNGYSVRCFKNTKNTDSLVLHANGGTGAVISLLSGNDTLTISSLGTPTKASASFDGWYTTGDNVTSEKVGEGSGFAISSLTDGKLELYAMWSCDEGYSLYEGECQETRYTVTIEGSGDVVSLEGTTFSGYYHSGDNVSLTFTANPDGIISWTGSDENVVITSGDNGHTISFTMPNSDIILYPSIQAYRSLSFLGLNHITIKSGDAVYDGGNTYVLGDEIAFNLEYDEGRTYSSCSVYVGEASAVNCSDLSYIQLNSGNQHAVESIQVTMPDNNIKIRLGAANIRYVIQYDLKGGNIDSEGNSGLIDDYSIVTSTGLISPENRDEYSQFSGWILSGYDEAVTTIDHGSIGSARLEDVILIADWTCDNHSQSNEDGIHCVPKKHTVTYDYTTNGGTSILSGEESISEVFTGEVAYTGDIDLSFIGVKEGYEFLGWTNDNSQTGVLESLKMGDADVTLYAVYRQVLTGTFHGNNNTLSGGDALNEVLTSCVLYNNDASCSLAIPSINAHANTPEVIGYSTGADVYEVETIGVTVLDSGNVNYEGGLSVLVSTGVELYAQTYTPAITYDTITYVKDSSDAHIQSVGVGSGSCTIDATYNGEEQATSCTVIAPEVITYNGYEGYWGIDENGKVLPGNELNVSASSTTFTAYSEGEHYQISYYLDGGSWEENKVSSGSYQEGDVFSFYVPVKEGYTFIGWTTGNGTDPDMDLGIVASDKGAKTFFAHWRKDSYKISYNDLEKGTSNLPKTYTYANGVTIPAPDKAPRGYEFSGWIDENDTDLGTEFTIAEYTEGDKEYTATWKAIEYSITYDLRGGNLTGSDENPAKYTVESEDITLKNPVRDHSEFLGWTGSNGSNAQQEVIIASNSVGAKSYSANWMCEDGYIEVGEECVRNTFVVSFDSKGGSVVESINVVSGNVAEEPEDPTKDGYDVFSGWYLTGTDDEYDFTTVVTGDVELYAKWNTKQCTISFDSNGGSPVNPIIKDCGSELGVPASSQRANSNFAYWHLSGVTEDVDAMTLLTEDITLYAAWTCDAHYQESADGQSCQLAQYSITYHLSGGVNHPDNPDSYVYDNETVVIEEPTREGYTFDGWLVLNVGKNEAAVQYARGTYEITEDRKGYDKELTARWKANTNTSYKVFYALQTLDDEDVYDIVKSDYKTDGTTDTEKASAYIPYEGFSCLNSGDTIYISADGKGEVTYRYTRNEYTLTISTGAEESYTTGVKYGADITSILTEQIPSAREEGEDTYIFNGWDTEAITMPAGGLTVTANWVKNAYAISYEGIEGADNSLNAATYTYGNEVRLQNPTKNGYAFEYWEDEDGNHLTADDVAITTTTTGDKVFTGHWTVNTYTITYAIPEGVGEVTNENPTTYTITGITLMPLSRDGYHFSGFTWGEITTPVENLTIPANTIADDITVTAHFSPIEYTIVKHLYDEVVDNVPYTIEEENDIYLGTELTRTGYTFLGWTGGEYVAADKNARVKKGSTGNIEFTANWSEDAYTISYVLDGGTNNANNVNSYKVSDIPEGGLVIASPTKEGYTFSGWIENDGDTPEQTLTITTSNLGNKSYTAVWDAIDYAISYNLNSGNLVNDTNPATYTINDTFTLANPERLGYEFNGWSGTAISGVKKTVNVSHSTGERTYEAVWSPISYTIEYDYDEGELGEGIVNVTSYTIESDEFVLNEPARTGYDFAGWKGTGISGTTPSITVSQGSVGNRSYTAVWKEGTNTPYKVIHVKQGLDGLYHSGDTTLTETENKTGKTNNSVTGYRKSYVGFITPAEQETARIEADGSTVIEYDYARRTFKYTLNTDVTGANVLGSTTSNDEMFYEAPIVLSGDKEIGYTWSGWNIISGTKHIFIADNQTGFIMPLNNVEVTPVVIHNQWRLSYDVNGGTGDSLEEQFPRYYDDEIVLPVPTREGYDFSGWYDEDMHYYTGTIHMPDADLALKAYWNAKPFVLNVSHYRMNLSGTYEDVEPEVVTMDVHLDDDNVTGVVKEYTGFTLSGDEQVIHIATDGSSKIDYYYERDKHAVSVVLATGVVLSEESTQSGEYFFETPIMLEASVQTGYTWSGWKVNDEELDTNTGISFDLGTGDVMLEAFATPNTYRAVFKNDTGDIILDEEVVFGEVIPLPTESLTKTGYLFGGWRNLPADGRMSAGDLELTPIWNTPSNGNTGGGGSGSSGSSRSSSSFVTSSSNSALTSADEQANNDKYVAGEESSFQASKYSGVELSRGNLARMVTILIDLFPSLVEGKEVVNGEECNEYADEGLFTKKERDAVARLCSIGVMGVHNDTKKPIPSFESRKKATENEFALVMRRLLVDFHEEETNSVIEKYLGKEEVLHFGAVYDIAYALKHLLEKK